MEIKQKEQLKKVIIFSALGLLFALSMWFIFSPSEKEKSKEENGLNKSIPQASVEELTDNKLKAYEMGEHLNEQAMEKDEMGRLSDYFSEKTDVNNGNRINDVSSEKIEQSIGQYERNSQLISSFYREDEQMQKEKALREELDSLKAQMDKDEAATYQEEENRQLALMEKSYQMAAKYMPIQAQQAVQTTAPTTKAPSTYESLPEMEIISEHKRVVSSLEQPMSDSAFIAEYGIKERNMGFNTLNGSSRSLSCNTLRVVVDRTVTVREGEYVILRLLDAARIQDIQIPRQYRITAQAKISGNRMHLIVKSIEVGGNISAVKLSAYDTDGQEGIYIPGFDEITALKEVGANIGGSMGTSFTFASSAKDQIISEAARGVMQGASGLIQKKLNTIKVTLKSGYRLFLVQTK